MNITIPQALRWLNKQRETTVYPYLNDNPCGCLFSRVAKHYLKNPRARTHLNGQIKTTDWGPTIGTISFHDDFWKIARKQNLTVTTEAEGFSIVETISRNNAIKVLKQLLPETPKTKTTYKVVVNEGGKLLSANARGTLVRKCVNYKWNTWNTPPEGSNPFLFVFDNVEDAISFAKDEVHFNNVQVYKIRAKNPTIEKIGQKTRYVPDPRYRSKDYPKGTLFADAVKLVKRVKI